MEEDSWLMAQGEAWRDGQQARAEATQALAAELHARHQRDAWQRRAAHVAVIAGGVVVVVISARMVWLRGQHLLAALALLYIPLTAFITARMEQTWRAKQAALARPPAQLMLALEEQLAARERETRWGQRFLKLAVVFTLVLGGAVWWHVPRPVTLGALATALLVHAAVAYQLHIREPRELTAQRARHDVMRGELSDDSL